MKISTKYYQMRRKNKKGLLLLGVLFLLIVAIIGGGTRYFLSPTSINSHHNSSSNFKNSTKSTTKTGNKPTTKSSDKVTTTNSSSYTTNSSSTNMESPNNDAGGTVASNYSGSQSENQLNTTAIQEQSNTPEIYSANYEGYVGTSTISYDDAITQAQNKYNAAVEAQQQTAESIAQSFVQNGYETHIIQDQGGN